jgi:ferritin-like metal-binding protein YciE
MQTARDLLEHELMDAYDAETRLVDALHTIEQKVTDQKLAAAFKDHRDQTERQLQRLTRVFGTLGIGPEREECEGIKGLIEEFEEFLNEKPSDQVLNLFAAGAARKVEQRDRGLRIVDRARITPRNRGRSAPAAGDPGRGEGHGRSV